MNSGEIRKTGVILNSKNLMNVMQFKQLLSLAIFVSMFLNVFAPTLAAQEPKAQQTATERTATVGGSCFTSTISSNDGVALREALAGFQAQQINSMNDQQAKQNMELLQKLQKESEKQQQVQQQPSFLPTQQQAPQNPSQVVVNNYIPAQGSPTVFRLDEAAKQAGVDVEEVSRFLGKPADGLLTQDDIEKLLRSEKASTFQNILGIPRRGELDWRPFTTMKIRLSSGQVVPLSEVIQKEPIDGSCLLDSSYIEGKVSYQGLLTEDITVGYDYSPTTRNAYQHIASSNTLAVLDLSQGGNIVIPDTYMYGIEKMGFWSFVDLMATMVPFVTTGLKEREKLAKRDSEYKEAIKQSDLISKRESGVLGSLALRQLHDENSIRTVLASKIAYGEKLTADELEDYVDKFSTFIGRIKEARGGTFEISDDAEEKVEAALRKFFDDTKSLDKIMEEREIFDKYRESSSKLFDQLETAGVMSRTHRNAIFDSVDKGFWQRAAGKPVSEFEVLQSERLLTQLGARTFNGVALGMAWMGAGRFALHAANSIQFNALSNRENLDSYIVLYVNKINAKIKKFHDATDFAGIGLAIDAVSSLLHYGVPSEIWKIGPVFVINSQDLAEKENDNSVTSINFNGREFQIQSSWKGTGYTTFFEDIRNKKDYARLQVFTSNMSWDLGLGEKLERKGELSTIYGMLPFIAPFLSWKLFPASKFLDAPTVILFRLVGIDLVVKNFLNPADLPAAGKEEMCSKAEVDKRIALYVAGIVGSNIAFYSTTPFFKLWREGFAAPLVKAGEAVSTKVQSLAPVTRQVPILWDKSKDLRSNMISAYKNLAFIMDPIEVAKYFAATSVLTYITGCKDTAYTILAWQPLEFKVDRLKILKDAASAKDNPLSQLVQGLSLQSVLGGVGKKIEEDFYTDILSLRAETKAQEGIVRPKQIFYLHLDGATQQWGGAFENFKKPVNASTAVKGEAAAEVLKAEQRGCFKALYQDPKSGKSVDISDKGITVKDANGTTLFQRTGDDWAIRALMHMVDPKTGQLLIPNRIITTQLASSATCSPTTATMFVRSDAHLVADLKCPGGKCILDEVSKISKLSTNDLSEVLGVVKSIWTDEGEILAGGNVIKFTQKKKKLEGGIGIPLTNASVPIPIVAEASDVSGRESWYPSVDAVGAGQKESKEAVEILTNGRVQIGADDRGELRTIFLQNGKIEFNPNTRQMHLWIATLDEINIDRMRSIGNTEVGKTDLGAGKVVDTPRIDPTTIIPTAPQDAPLVEKAKEALEAIQKNPDGTPGGLHTIVVNNSKVDRVEFAKDKEGDAAVQIVKPDGTTESLKITGPASYTPDGKGVVIPTEKGPMTFNFGTAKDPVTGASQPVVNINGAGLNEIAPLLAAKGNGGIAVFDPTTGLWRMQNAFTADMDKRFAKDGLTYQQGQNGLQGFAQADQLSLPRKPSVEPIVSRSPSLNVPSLPDNLLAIVLIISAVVGVIVAIRVTTARRKKFG